MFSSGARRLFAPRRPGALKPEAPPSVQSARLGAAARFPIVGILRRSDVALLALGFELVLRHALLRRLGRLSGWEARIRPAGRLLDPRCNLPDVLEQLTALMSAGLGVSV